MLATSLAFAAAAGEDEQSVLVERTFSWFGRNRRLAKDFENLAETLATFVTLASIQLALRRLARE
jgi:transposase